ncbi:cupin domain-containing protein [Aquisalinus flavus]|nr:cupin domain-containing protein [Aquisalinus flavus]MBD0428141.1 cupin domain-containing protein [Aquisalinus flavus]
MHLEDIAARIARQSDLSVECREFLRVPAISAGLYRLKKGEKDPQTPHRQDEIYYVIKGRGQFTVGGETASVGPGAFLYVARMVEHRFHDIEEDIDILVLFSPAEVA